jgi:isoleucyl-tRNA synthetase
VPGKTVESAHQLTWQPIKFELSETERALWRTLFELRALALPVLERARQAKEIGKALEARLTFSGKAALLDPAKPQREVLRELLNVSQLELIPDGEADVVVSVEKAAGQKCERCWHWETDVGSTPEHPTICGRCVSAVTK